MKALHRLSGILGGKTLSIMTLIVACFVVLSGFWYQQQQVIDTAQSQARQLRQRLVETTFNNVSSAMAELTDKVSIAAQVNEMVAVFENGIEDTVNLQQKLLARGMPEAKKVCLMDLDIDKPDLHACVPITFAVLELLREAQAEKESTPFAVIGKGNEKKRIVITKQVANGEGKAVGILLATFDGHKILNLLPKLGVNEGYIALQQGKSEKTALAFRGNTNWKSGTPDINHHLKGSYWDLGYWAAPPEDLDTFWGVVIAVLLGLSLLWLWRDFWQGLLLRKDMDVIDEQVQDWKRNELKLKYSVSSLSAKGVVKTIMALGVLREVGTGRQATAATMNMSNEAHEPVVERLESVSVETEKTEVGPEVVVPEDEPAAIEEVDEALAYFSPIPVKDAPEEMSENSNDNRGNSDSFSQSNSDDVIEFSGIIFPEDKN